MDITTGNDKEEKKDSFSGSPPLSGSSNQFYYTN